MEVDLDRCRKEAGKMKDWLDRARMRLPGDVYKRVIALVYDDVRGREQGLCKEFREVGPRAESGEGARGVLGD